MLSTGWVLASLTPVVALVVFVGSELSTVAQGPSPAEDRLFLAVGSPPIAPGSEDRGLNFSTENGSPAPARPTLADRIEAVTQGRVEIEGGYTFVRDRFDGIGRSQHLFPDLLLRLGITDRLELRFGWAGYLAEDYDSRAPDMSASRVLDPTLGFMFDLIDGNDWIPQTAISAAIPVSFQGSPFAASSFQPLSRALYRWDLSERMAVGGTTGVGLFREDGENYWQFEQTAEADYVLTDRLDAFAEWQMLVDRGSVDDRTQHLLSLGVGYLWSDHFQVSWRAGVGLTRYSPDFLTGIRLSLRF